MQSLSIKNKGLLDIPGPSIPWASTGLAWPQKSHLLALVGSVHVSDLLSTAVSSITCRLRSSLSLVPRASRTRSCLLARPFPLSAVWIHSRRRHRHEHRQRDTHPISRRRWIIPSSIRTSGASSWPALWLGALATRELR